MNHPYPVIQLFGQYLHIPLLINKASFSKKQFPEGRHQHFWVHKTIYPRHFEVTVSSKEYERSCIYVLGVLILLFFQRLFDWILKCWDSAIIFSSFYCTKTPATFFYWSVYIKPWTCAVMYLCASGINCVFFSMIFRLNFGNVKTVRYYFFFIFCTISFSFYSWYADNGELIVEHARIWNSQLLSADIQYLHINLL